MAEKPVPSKHARKESRWTPDEYRQRPRDYDPALADRIVDMVRNNEVLTDICLDRDMPLPGTFLVWCDQDPALNEAYHKALAMGAEIAYDEAVSEAFGNDTFRAGLRSRAMMQRAERSLPHKYGPKAAIQPPPGGNDDQPTGVDYAAEVRRKLQAMADRLAADASPPTPAA